MAARVLHVCTALDRGGAEAVVETITAELDRERYEPILAVPRGSALIGAWRAAGWSVHETPPVRQLRHLRAGWAMVQALERLVRTCDVRVVHTHGTAAQIYGGRAAARAGCPVVWQTHDTFHARWTVEGLLHRLAAAQRHDVVIAISETVAASLRGWVPADSLAVIPNGVRTDRVTPATRASRAPLVVWCGRLQRWKGTHLFLDVAARVRRDHPAARFAVVGGTLFGLEPDYPAELRAQADALALGEAVDWVGQVRDARPWLAAADVIVHSSVAPEPFGLVVAEAMMQARPVVAFRLGGPAEMVVDGETGALVPAGDVEAMALAVGTLLAQPEEAARLGAAGRVRAVREYSAGGMVRRIESAYDHVCT